MSEMFVAMQRTLGSLGSGRIWLYILGPALAAMLLQLEGLSEDDIQAMLAG